MASKGVDGVEALQKMTLAVLMLTQIFSQTIRKWTNVCWLT